MKAKVLLLLLPLLICLIPQTQAQTGIDPLSISYDLNTYIETKIIVSYTFTDEVSSNASSMGQSVWQVAVDPLSSSFVTSAADRFTWKLGVKYSAVITQYVSITVFSGLEAVDVISFFVTTDNLLLSFNIVVTQQPTYPTVEDLAEKTIEVLSNELVVYGFEREGRKEAFPSSCNIGSLSKS